MSPHHGHHGHHGPYVPTREDLDGLRSTLPPDASEVLQAALEGTIDDSLLSRWLVARKGDVKAAAAMLNKHIEWRRGPGRPVDEQAHGVQVNLEHKKVFLQGLDKTGRPIVLGVGTRHRRFACKEDALLFCQYALDTAVAIGNSHEGWDGKLTGVFDLRNLSTKNADLTALQVMFELLQNHYPERLGRLFLYEAPTIFYAIWRVVSPWVDPVTKTKINFISHKTAHEEFAKVFDLELLPREMGGEGGWHSIDEAHKQALERVAKRKESGIAESSITSGDSSGNVLATVAAEAAAAPAHAEGEAAAAPPAAAKTAAASGGPAAPPPQPATGGNAAAVAAEAPAEAATA